MKRSPRQYLVVFFGFAFGLFAAIGAFNFTVDPFGLFPGPEIAGFNAIKADVDKHVRMVKAFQVRANPPHGLIIGSSRALLGVPANHPAWPNSARPVYNLSLYGGYLYETMRYFQHAAAMGSVRDTVLALDLWMFARDWAARPGFSEDRLLVSVDGQPIVPDDLEPVRALFSWDTLRSSVRTISRQGRDDILVQRGDGTSVWRSETGWLRSKQSHRAQFGYMERMFGSTAWQPRRAERWDIADPADPTSPLQYFRTMVRLAHEKEIALKIAISPSHARIWETLRAGDMWPTWENWKRALLTITVEEAARAGVEPFPLWDFSGYNAITTEDVPRDASPMQYYWDGSHFKQNVGGMMLERLFGVDKTDVPGDFGQRLTPHSIEAVLAQTRAARMRYAESHARDVEEASRWASRLN